MATRRTVNDVWSLVERLVKSGNAGTTDDQAAINWLQNELGLKRNPTEYAARTRRRYRAAGRAGESAQQVNKREYQQRQAGSRARMNKLIARRNELLPEVPVDMDEVNEYVDTFGTSNVIDMLVDQIDSCEHYQRDDSVPGHRRWVERRHTREVRPDFTSYLGSTDIMYYYHSRRA